jgi:hypothetical protein
VQKLFAHAIIYSIVLPVIRELLVHAVGVSKRSLGTDFFALDQIDEDEDDM